MRRGKPNDPGRRSRILEATLDVIRADGVSAASYRRIASHAGVPLGSVTYYFPTLEGLIVSAFDSTRGHLEPRYAAPLCYLLGPITGKLVAQGVFDGDWSGVPEEFAPSRFTANA